MTPNLGRILMNFLDVAAKEAMQDMPPRLEEELDPVTLHNQALIHMDTEPATGFEKLIFLLQQAPCPSETFGNLLLMYLKFEYYDAAADLLAENSVLARSVLSRYLVRSLFNIALYFCEKVPKTQISTIFWKQSCLNQHRQKILSRN
jgi:hypothetical protein